MLQQLNELVIHKIEIVGNIKNRYPLVLEETPELLRDLVSMRFFHHQDDVSPLDEIAANRRFSVQIGPRANSLDTVVLRKDGRSRWASQAILAAHEENLHLSDTAT